MLIKKYTPAHIHLQKNKLNSIDPDISEDILELSEKKILNRTNFINFFLKKKESLFRFLFCDFCLLFIKKFKNFFSCRISIKFSKMYVEFDYKKKYLENFKYVGKLFSLSSHIEKGLLLVSKDFLLFFIQRVFGNTIDSLCRLHANQHLTFNEINVSRVLFEKIFYIFNKTFNNNSRRFFLEKHTYTELDYHFYKHFFNFSYICLVFKVDLYKMLHLLKIYIPFDFIANYEKMNK